MNSHPSFASLFAIACVLSTSSRARAQHVLVVDSSGPYTQIQPAVDAAIDGDTILVKSGTYPGFTISDKSLSVVGDSGAHVYVQTRVSVVALSSTKYSVLAGLILAPTPGSQPSDLPALALQDDAGSVRIEACMIRGSPQTTPHTAGSPGALLSNCSDVGFSACTILGGHGGPGPSPDLAGGQGGIAVGAQSSRVAMYDCTLGGGDGGHGFEGGGYNDSGDGGRGGAGYVFVDDGFAFASGTHFQGGNGGDGGDGSGTCMPGYIGGDGGPGGHGIRVLGSAPPSHGVALLDDTPVGGSGGTGGNGISTDWCITAGRSGPSGSAIVSPSDVVDHVSGAARTFSTPAVVRENLPFAIEFHGRPGDVVWVYLGQGPAFDYNVPFHGVNLTTIPPIARPLRLGVIPSSGALTLQRSMPDFGVPSRTRFMQAVFKAPSGSRWLAGPATLVVLDSIF